MQKKIPMRMCVGCREMKPKRELVRVVCNKEGEVFVDPTGKANGRGAYVCRSGDCRKKAVKTRALERAFSMKIGEDVFESLNARIADVPKEADEGGGEA